MLKNSIFISRTLEPSSLFFSQLPKEINLKHYSLLHFNQVDISTFPPTDYIFFYSRNAVHFFFSQNPKFPPHTKLACLGLGTNKELEKWNKKADFIGKGSSPEVAQQFLAVAQGQKVLFPRAKNSGCSIQKMLQGKIISDDIVVYENTIKPTFPNPHANILIFTSSMNARAYFSLYPFDNQTVISIGENTSETLRKLGIVNALESEVPTEESLLKTCLTLI